MIQNTFDKGEESWCSYDYHARIVSKWRNIFILATWESEGGVGNSGYVWADETRWSADVPEKPLSILPLLFYQRWINEDPVDLRGAQVSFYLRGDDLQMHGAQCFFWVLGHGGRWHLNSQPIAVSDGVWSPEPTVLTLVNDESEWHHSWAGWPPQDTRLEPALRGVASYGFSFVGFWAEVSGKLSLDEFVIQLKT